MRNGRNVGQKTKLYLFKSMFKVLAKITCIWSALGDRSCSLPDAGSDPNRRRRDEQQMFTAMAHDQAR